MQRRRVAADAVAVAVAGVGGIISIRTSSDGNGRIIFSDRFHSSSSRTTSRRQRRLRLTFRGGGVHHLRLTLSLGFVFGTGRAITPPGRAGAAFIWSKLRKCTNLKKFSACFKINQPQKDRHKQKHRAARAEPANKRPSYQLPAHARSAHQYHQATTLLRVHAIILAPRQRGSACFCCSCVALASFCLFSFANCNHSWHNQIEHITLQIEHITLRVHVFHPPVERAADDGIDLTSYQKYQTLGQIHTYSSSTNKTICHPKHSCWTGCDRRWRSVRKLRKN